MSAAIENPCTENTFQSTWINWLLFYGAVFLFMANLFATIAIFPAYSLYLGSSPFLAGLQNTLFTLSAVFYRFYFGPLMDQRGAKPLMLFGVFTFITAPLFLLFSPSYSILLIVRLYQAIGLATVLPGITTLIAEMSPPGRIGSFLGSVRIFINLGLLAGPASALYLISLGGYRSWFIAGAATSLLTFILLAPVKSRQRIVNVEAFSGSWRQVQEALAVKAIYPIIGGIALIAFIYNAIISFTAVYLEQHAPGPQAAYFFVLFGGAGIIGALTAGVLSDRFGRRQIAWPLVLTLGLGAIIFSLLPTWPALLLAAALIFGISIQGGSLVFAAWLIDLAKPELRATTVSIQENTIDLAFSAGALSFGLAAQGFGLSYAFLASGLITILATIPLLKISATKSD